MGTATTDKTQPRQFTALESHTEATSLSTSTTNVQLEALSLGVDIITSNYSQSKSTSQSTRSAKIPKDQSKEPATKGTVTDIKNTKGMICLNEEKNGSFESCSFVTFCNITVLM